MLVNGNPLENLALLTDTAKIHLVMKDGVVHNYCATPVPDKAALHLGGTSSPLVEDGVKEALAEMLWKYAPLALRRGDGFHANNLIYGRFFRYEICLLRLFHRREKLSNLLIILIAIAWNTPG